MYNILKSIIIIIFLSIFMPVSAESIDHRETFVVGIIANQSQDASKNNDLDLSYGITFDYLSNIAKALNIKLEIRNYHQVQKLLDDVESNNIDGALGFSKTIPRMERFLFSNIIFSSSIAVWYLDSEFEQKAVEKIKWACVRGSIYCEELVRIGAAKIEYVDNLFQAFDYVLSGKANALISTYVSINRYLDQNDIIKGIVEIPNWFEQEDLRFITSTHNSSLVDKINKVLEWEDNRTSLRSVVSENVYHINDKLLADYRHEVGTKNIISYSSSEEAFPFLSRDSHTQEFEGFLVDFISLIRSRTGLDFAYLPPKGSFDSGLTAFEADLVPVAFIDDVDVPEWLITKPFMRTRFISVRSKSFRNEMIEKDVGILMSLKKQGVVHLGSWKQERFTRYSSLQKLLTDLESGKLSTAYVPDDIVHTFLANGNADGLQFDEDNALLFSIAFAISDNNIKLKKVIDSTIDTLDKKEIDKIFRSYRAFNVIYGYDDTELMLIATIVIFVFITLLLVVYFIFSHLRMKVHLAELNKINEEKEKDWLMTIIQEINSVVFIHGEDFNLHLSNCSLYRSGQCNKCQIYSSENKELLVGNKDELRAVLSGENIDDMTPAAGCEMQIGHVYRTRKMILSPNSNKKFALTVLQDITDQKQREFALIKAREKAQTAIRSRDNFLATMSHELRTPLSAVQGILELASTQKDGEVRQRLLAQAGRSLDHLNTIVSEVLDYSKLDSGAVSINPVETDLLSEICNLLRSFEPMASGKGLSYRVLVRPMKNQWVLIDNVRLTQVLTNLLSNAVKFTSNGEVSVAVGLDENELEVVIADTGIGMDENQLSNALKPFVQADDSITRKYGGTGLGLSIVSKLVRHLGGEMNINSKLEVGTRIIVKLPVEVSDKNSFCYSHLSYSENLPSNVKQWCIAWGMDSTESRGTISQQLDEDASFKGVVVHRESGEDVCLSADDIKYPDVLKSTLCTLENTMPTVSAVENKYFWTEDIILVAEDNAINQKVISLQLDECGINHVIVNNGVEAIRYLKNNREVALILTDFHMPEMSGYELIEVLKSSTEFDSIPIIGLTAEDARLGKERTRHLNIDDILYKPYTLEKLKLTLHPFVGLQKPNWLNSFTYEEAIDIAKLFCSSMTNDLEKLSQSSSFDVKKQVIHRIKGALGLLEVTELVHKCVSAESMAGVAFQQEVDSLIEELQQEIMKVNLWIEHHEK